jgi:hypothetical protein
VLREVVGRLVSLQNEMLAALLLRCAKQSEPGDIVQWAHRNPDSPHSFHVLKALARSIYEDPNASAEDLREAVRVFENVPATSSRVFGPAHPDTKKYEEILAKAKRALAEKSSA